MARSQRNEPGDPRAKAIEAMARAEREVARRVYDGHDKRAEALLAALEAEGWGLTSTREVERLTIERDEMRRANVTPEDADRPLGQSVEYWQDRCLDLASALDDARVKLRAAEREGERLRGLLAEAVPWLDHEPDEGRELARRIEAALSSVPVEEEEKP
jgi:hypothetical protein